MKVAAVVILYHPSEIFITNIKTYYSFVQKVYVYDNTETKSGIQSRLLELSKVELCHDFENKGIAARLNTACNKAIQEGFEWLLTMDQDTSFEESDITNYFKCFSQYQPKNKVAVFGPVFDEEKGADTEKCTVKEVDKLITSGSLLNLSLFKQIGDFDEALFIDAVDFDYCFRSKIKGFAILQFSKIHILHTVGNQVHAASIKTLFLLKKKKEVHSPLRCYYMYRNMLYLQKKYQNEDPVYFKQIKGYIMARIKTSIFYGRQPLQILRYLRAAKKDSENNNMGKIEQQL